MGNPQKFQFGWRVKRTTTRSGTKKIRKIVKLFGRFISLSERQTGEAARCNGALRLNHSPAPIAASTVRATARPRMQVSSSANPLAGYFYRKVSPSAVQIPSVVPNTATLLERRRHKMSFPYKDMINIGLWGTTAEWSYDGDSRSGRGGPQIPEPFPQGFPHQQVLVQRFSSE